LKKGRQANVRKRSREGRREQVDNRRLLRERKRKRKPTVLILLQLS
jgi:hypothetical protein